MAIPAMRFFGLRTGRGECRRSRQSTTVEAVADHS
jgi:hypothetical protein